MSVAEVRAQVHRLAAAAVPVHCVRSVDPNGTVPLLCRPRAALLHHRPGKAASLSVYIDNNSAVLERPLSNEP